MKHGGPPARAALPSRRALDESPDTGIGSVRWPTSRAGRRRSPSSLRTSRRAGCCCRSCSGSAGNVTATLKKLQMLSFIHYARWVVVKRFPDGGGGERLQLPVPAVREQLQRELGPVHRRLLGGRPRAHEGHLGHVVRLPGPDPGRAVQGLHPRQRVRRQPLLVNAYPGATTTEIISAAQGRRGARRAARARAPSLDPAAFKTAYEDMLTRDPARPMSRNVSGQAYALTVLTPILDGHAAELTAHLDALPEGDASPLARVPGHPPRALGRDRPGQVPGPRAAPARLADARRACCSRATSTATLDPYLERLRTGLGEDADAIWGHCRGYPGRGRRRFAALAARPPDRGRAVLRRLRRPDGRAGAREPRQARSG